MKKILIDINHPADVHFFRNTISILKSRGIAVKVCARNKEMTLDLLKEFNLDYEFTTEMFRSRLGMFNEFLRHHFKIYRICKQFKPDLTMSAQGLLTAMSSRFAGIPSITFMNSENQVLSNSLTKPFSSMLVSPSSYSGKISTKKKIRYQGYHELAYLHPDRFEPDKSILKEFGLSENEPFFIVRFVSWMANHDIGHEGFSNFHKEKLVDMLSQYGRVIISSECELSGKLKENKYHISTHKVHHLLAFAKMYVGEGATFASEAATLGIPTLYINTQKPCYITELEEKYGLLHQFDSGKEMFPILMEMLEDKDLNLKWHQKRQVLLNDKIDVTGWAVDYIETFLKNGSHRN